MNSYNSQDQLLVCPVQAARAEKFRAAGHVATHQGRKYKITGIKTVTSRDIWDWSGELRPQFGSSVGQRHNAMLERGLDLSIVIELTSYNGSRPIKRFQSVQCGPLFPYLPEAKPEEAKPASLSREQVVAQIASLLSQLV